MPVRFVSTMPFHSSSGRSRVGARLMRPAQFTRMSILPNAASTASRARSSEARSQTSAGTRSVRRPFSSISLAVDSTFSAVRAQATTSAPASAMPSDSARPIPCVPPSTTATLPVRSREG